MKTLNQLARDLGGDRSGVWINIPGPGHKKKDRSLGIAFDSEAPDGFWIHSLAGDDRSECRHHVLELFSKVSAGAVTELLSITDQDTVAQAKIDRALALWEEAAPPGGTLVEEYLTARRCDLKAVQEGVLRFHPCCPFGPDRVPAMIALMRDIETDEPKGIHRTALADDGRGKRLFPCGQSPKRMLGVPKSAAIKLQSHNGQFGIAEGIETALSVWEVFKVPTWALMSA